MSRLSRALWDHRKKINFFVWLFAGTFELAIAVIGVVVPSALTVVVGSSFALIFYVLAYRNRPSKWRSQ